MQKKKKIKHLILQSLFCVCTRVCMRVCVHARVREREKERKLSE